MRYIIFIILLSPIHIFSQNVGIGTNSPDPSAKLEIQSTSGGILIPRLTSAERDLIPDPKATGLLIFNSSSARFEFWNGSMWGPIASVASDISDADGDTKIDLENTSDDNKIPISGGELSSLVHDFIDDKN